VANVVSDLAATCTRLVKNTIDFVVPDRLADHNIQGSVRLALLVTR
jgi:hypothetical protein